MTETLNDAATDPQQTIAELQRKLVERTAERDELLQQRTATADVLKVISRSAFDLEFRAGERMRDGSKTLRCRSGRNLSPRGGPLPFRRLLRVPSGVRRCVARGRTGSRRSEVSACRIPRGCRAPPGASSRRNGGPGLFLGDERAR